MDVHYTESSSPIISRMTLLPLSINVHAEWGALSPLLQKTWCEILRFRLLRCPESGWRNRSNRNLLSNDEMSMRSLRESWPMWNAGGGEATVPLFRSLLTLGLAGDWLTLQKRPGSGIPAIFGDSMSNIPKWKSKIIFVKQTLIFDIRPSLITDFHHGQGSFAYPYPTKPFDEVLREMDFQNFMKKPGQSPSFSVRPENCPVDVESPSMGHLTIAVDNDQVESSYYSRDKGVMGHELVVVGEGCSEQDVMAVGGSKKRRLITEALEEEATVMRPVSKKKILKAQKNKDVEGSQVVKDLRSENALNLEEMSMMQKVTTSSKECRKKLVEEVDGLQSCLKETEHLGQRCQDFEHERDFLLKKSKEVSVLAFQLEAAKLEKSKLVKDFIPLADLKDVHDYHPEVEKIFDEAADSFYKLEFPYISLLVENAGLSSEELASLEAPSAQEAHLP
ncbi:hypothetical protein Tco_0817419 [Tanacetum coccineum]